MKKLNLLLIIVLTLSLSLLLASCGNETVDTSNNPTETTTDNVETTTELVTTEPPAPAIATIGVTSTSGDYTVALDWDDVTGAEQYEVYFSYAGTDTYDLLTTAAESAYTWDDAKWGQNYNFIIKALAGGEVIGESEPYAAKPNGIRVNDYAPKDDKMVIYFKPMSDKSDGFVIYINGEIYILDGGLSSDSGIKNYINELRKEWLGDDYAANAMNFDAKIAVNVIVSHFHSDHNEALINFSQNKFSTIENVYVPERAEMDVSSENRRDRVESSFESYNHNFDWIIVPFGEEMNIEFIYSDSKLDLYPSVVDWTKTVPGNIRIGWLFICNVQSSESARTTYAINCNSLWAKFTDPSGKSALFTGDTGDENVIIQGMLEHYGVEKFDVDVLKYLHHGSARYSLYLTQMTTPEITVFTASDDNLKGNNSKNAFQASASIGAVYNAHDGDLTITFDHGEIIEEGIAPRADGRK